MNKKILAVALAILFIATAFTACKSKLDMTEINGKEYPLVTDKDGETIINEENKVAVLVTDENGEVIKYENGEDQTYWVQLKTDTVFDDYILSKDHKLGIPDGWEGTQLGDVQKKDTDGKCYIRFTKNKKLDSEETFEAYIEELDSLNDSLAEALADEEKMNAAIKQNPAFAVYKGCNYVMEEDSAVITDKGLNCTVRVHKIIDKNGDVCHYAENYIFMSGSSIYSINYICEDGKGYDESFDFANYLSRHFVFTGKPEK